MTDEDMVKAIEETVCKLNALLTIANEQNKLEIEINVISFTNIHRTYETQLRLKIMKVLLT